MTSSFTITIRRYKNGENRYMDEQARVPKIEDAFHEARIMVRMSGYTDPDAIFRIHSVKEDGPAPGPRCTIGWMTDDELAAKIAKEKAQQV